MLIGMRLSGFCGSGRHNRFWIFCQLNNEYIRKDNKDTPGRPLAPGCPGSAAGVREIQVRERAGAFKVICVARFADVVYVLHAFQKKTRQTAKRDVDLAASRLREQVDDHRGL
jgi:phage-related protein